MKFVSLLYFLVELGLLFAEDATTESSVFIATTTKGPITSPCPCTGQPEGIVIPHPSDCRAFYTCLGGINVRHSKCDNQDQFFHPYLRSCVQRSTSVSFVPDFIPTKDVCKITAVFPAPAMEDFDNCNIKSDETATNDLNSDEVFSLKNSASNNNPIATPTPELGNILSLFPWPLNKSAGLMNNRADSVTTPVPSQRWTPENPYLRPTTTFPTYSKKESCKLAKVVINHFPGPCSAHITCENGETITIDKCHSSLSLV